MRWLIQKDMAEVLAIDRQSFQNPWSEDDFFSALRQRNCMGQIVELNQRILGYIIYDLYDDMISIKRMAVDPDLRRLGLGSKMLGGMKDKLSRQKRTSLIMEVAGDDEAGQAFLRKAEFQADAVLRGGHRKSTDYIFRMRYSL
jgi:ribosomal-protein-alanine N-acetyltransferase